MLTALRVFGATLLLFASTRASAAVDRIFDDGCEQRVTFQIQSPSIPIAAGGAQTYCYFFSMPNTAAAGVKWWVSHMGAGMHHAILFTTANAAAADGTLTNQSPCGTFPGGQSSKWIYATHGLTRTSFFPPTTAPETRLH